MVECEKRNEIFIEFPVYSFNEISSCTKLSERIYFRFSRFTDFDTLNIKQPVYPKYKVGSFTTLHISISSFSFLLAYPEQL